MMIESPVVKHFTGVFCSQVSVAWEDSANFVSSLNLLKLNQNHINFLMEEFSMDEIKRAAFGLQSAPAFDGFHAKFFQHFWDIVGVDVCNMIYTFRERGFLFKGLNKTLIHLIPTCDVPQTFKDFRPISLYSVVYKIVSKVLANRSAFLTIISLPIKVLY